MPGEKIKISCRLSDIARAHNIVEDGLSAEELEDRLMELGYTQAAKEVHDLMQRVEKKKGSKFCL